MKVAILGGGFTGLTAAYYLAKKGVGVTLFEKENALGGLAVGFKEKNWGWYLERAYHHLFANDYDILDFAKEIGFEKIIFRLPETASLYDDLEFRIQSSELNHESRIKKKKILDSKLNSEFYIHNSKFSVYPLDTPQDFLRFPLLSWPVKIRSAAVLAFLKLSPFLNYYEKQTAQEFLQKSMGDEACNVLWQQLFRKKFGKYAGNIVASFIWARIKKRTKSLGYIEGGFQTLINYLEKNLSSLRVNLFTGYGVGQIGKRGNEFEIMKERFDAVVSTLPTAVMRKITTNLFPQDYLERFTKLKYLHAVNLILETKEPLLEKAYWLNVCSKEIPLMALVQHTNFMDKKNYGGNHILYVGWYVDREDRLLKMEDRELLKFVKPHLKKIQNSEFRIQNYYRFVGPFAQPIFDKEFVANKPDFITPQKNFYIANLDMTYPYDRGTNYAVKLGKQVAEFFS